MASPGKQPDLRLIGVVVFLCAGVTMMAANLVVGICMMVVGVALLAGSFIAGRENSRSTGSAATPPPAARGPDAEPGAAADGGA